MIYPHKVTITVNGASVKINQGTNSFNDIVAAAKEKGGINIANPKSFAVNTAAAAQNSTIGGNQSYVISGGEILTLS